MSPAPEAYISSIPVLVFSRTWDPTNVECHDVFGCKIGHYKLNIGIVRTHYALKASLAVGPSCYQGLRFRAGDA
jgi:hypothetical protein